MSTQSASFGTKTVFLMNGATSTTLPSTASGWQIELPACTTNYTITMPDPKRGFHCRFLQTGTPDGTHLCTIQFKAAKPLVGSIMFTNTTFQTGAISSPTNRQIRTAASATAGVLPGDYLDCYSDGDGWYVIGLSSGTAQGKVMNLSYF